MAALIDGQKKGEKLHEIRLRVPEEDWKHALELSALSGEPVAELCRQACRRWGVFRPYEAIEGEENGRPS